MVTTAPSPLLSFIRGIVEDQRVRELPDQELLQRFIFEQDQAAFQVLLRRHGPMVLDVCHCVLGDDASVEDAFQATFLVLATKAGSIRQRTSVSSWIHGVAHRTALRARVQSTVRHKHESRLPNRQVAATDELSWLEVRRALHEELERLPERFRSPLVLCFLEGFTQDAAAVQLRIAKSTLRARLDRGRMLLRTRLIRRGLGSSVLLASTALCSSAASAGLPGSLLICTAEAASKLVAGNPAATVVSARVTQLLNGTLNSLLMAKVKVIAAVLLVGLSALGVGAGMAPLPASGSSAKEGRLRKVATKQEQRKVPTWKIGKTLPGHDGQVTSVAFSPDGKQLASASRDGSVMVWDAAKHNLRHTMYCSDEVMALAFAPDGKSLVTASGMTNEDYSVIFWDPETGKKQATIKDHSYPIHHLSFSQDGKILVSTACPVDMRKAGQDRGEICFWNAETKVKIATLKRPLAYNAVLSHDGQKLLVASGGTLAVLSKIDDKFVSGEAESVWFQDQICCVAMAPDGKTVALAPVSGRSSLVTVHNFGTDTPLSSFLHKTGSVRCLAFSPDSETLVTGAWTSTNKGDESDTKKVGVEADE